MAETKPDGPAYLEAAMMPEDEIPYSEPCYGACISNIGWCCGAVFLVGCCGCCCSPYKQVRKGFKGIVQRFGRVVKVVNEGLYTVNPLSENMREIDIRTLVITLKEQTVLTKDNLSIKIDGVVYYTITDIDKAIFKVQDVNKAVEQLALVALRGVFGHKLMQECLEQREELAQAIEKIVSEKTNDWGVDVNMIQITDIVIPENIKNILSSAATAEREGKAKVILAEADVEAAKLMRQASDILSTSGAMQIRMLETYSKLAANPHAKIVFMPLDGSKEASGMFTNAMTMVNQIDKSKGF
jgi:erythrocyte band 7 integral membrane protein